MLVGSQVRTLSQKLRCDYDISELLEEACTIGPPES